MAQVDAAHEGHVTFRLFGVADDDELLVMRAAQPDTLVEQHLAAGRVQLLSETAVLLGAEPEQVQVRPPQQPFDRRTAPRCRGEDSLHLGVGIVGQALVGVASPVGEIQSVAGAQIANLIQQAAEVRRPVDQGFHLVAGAPRQAVGAPPVERAEIVAALGAREKPAIERRVRLHCGDCYGLRGQSRTIWQPSMPEPKPSSGPPPTPCWSCLSASGTQSAAPFTE